MAWDAGLLSEGRWIITSGYFLPFALGFGSFLSAEPLLGGKAVVLWGFPQETIIR